MEKCMVVILLGVTLVGHASSFNWVKVKSNKDEQRAYEESTDCSHFLKIKCPNVERCVYMWWVGDNQPDCGLDGVEEREQVKLDMCNCIGGFFCSNGPSHCLSPVSLCSGNSDCSDGEDEDPAVCRRLLVEENKCLGQPGYFLCNPDSDLIRCIPNSWVCDGIPDCNGDQDEANCNGYVAPAPGPECRLNGVPFVGDGSLEPNCQYGSQGKTICVMNVVAGDNSLSENCLYAHNKARAFHNSPPLTWNTDLEISARRYAMELPDLNALVHSHYGDYGENLFWLGSALASDITCADAVLTWYREVQFPQAYDGERWYDYTQAEQFGTDHFTQVVWKGTEEVGCSIVRTEQDKQTPFGGNFKWYEFWGVCHYQPGGNFEGTAEGYFQSNILEPTPSRVYGTELMDSPYDLELNGYCFNKYPECMDTDTCINARQQYCPLQCNDDCK